VHGLELNNANATLESVAMRLEKDGTDEFPAADLKLSVTTDADVLAYFAPMLRQFYYDESGPRDLAQTVPLRDSHMVFPHGRDEELVGAIVTVAYGVGSPMRFADARVNQFKLTPHPGGVVIIQCRVQCRPSEQQIGKLYLLQSRAVTLTIEPANQPRIGEAA
jgi:hypothetical protein